MKERKKLAWKCRCDWVLLNISRTLASHTFAHSHFLSFYRSLLCNSSDKIIVSQLLCNKGQVSPRCRGDQNQFETVSKRHRCCSSAYLPS